MSMESRLVSDQFTLHIFTPTGHYADFRLRERMTFGRTSPENTADIQVPSMVLSRHHGEFDVSEGRFFYRDTGSKNGTCLNGVTVTDARALQDGDILSVHPGGRASLPPAVVMLCTRQKTESLVWTSHPVTAPGQEYPVESTPSLPGVPVDRSRAILRWDGLTWSAVNPDNTGDVRVNGSQVTEKQCLRPMEVVRVRDVICFPCEGKLCVGSPPAEEESPARSRSSFVPHSKGAVRSGTLSVSIRERNVWVRSRKKTLLKDIHAEIHGGELVLVLGGSGAGKTTFINAVMGYEKADGTITYNNIDIYKEYEVMKYRIGYVPQQDLLRGMDSTYQTLLSAAKMKLPQQASEEVCDLRTGEIMALLGLERERDTLVQRLSGGQRKRLSIAVELIGDPDILFLDEPDSGLDSVMAGRLMDNLRTIADMGKIVIVITHSPDRAEDLFDQVLVLAKSALDESGHLAFFGPVQEALTFFETDHLEGIVRRINRQDEGGEGRADEFIRRYEQLVK